MTDPTFYIALACAIIAYPLQTVLIAKLYRRHDPIVMTALRGFGLGITGLAYFLFIPFESLAEIPANLHWIVLASLSGAVANWVSGQALRRIYVGMNSAILSPVRIILLSIFGVFFLGDEISTADILCISIIVISILSFSLPGMSSKISVADSPVFGVVLSVTAGLCMAITFSLFTHLSRSLGPFLASYLWELGIGIAALILYVPIGRLDKYEYEPVDWRTFLWATIYASPTVVGTGAVAYAVTVGSLPLAGAIMSLSIFVTAILGAIVHKEFPPRRAIAAMIVIVGSLVILQIGV